jgi:bifunctional non-homologous end joining protein LigD
MSSVQSTSTTVAGVRMTNPDRVMFPQQGATKRAIAEYYVRAADLMLPYLSRRPLTLVRCPEGRGEDCFFQKHAGSSVPDEIERIPIEERSGKTRDYMRVHSRRSLVATAQVGALELHIWGARSDRLERPERIVFDLDPDATLRFARVRDSAFELREVLDAAGLQSFALLTGGKGVHVIVPIRRTRPWTDVKEFAKGVATRLAEAAPERYVAKASKELRTGRIYLDWLRNERGATAIAPWSPRARPGAPVAAPVDWEELDEISASATFTLDNIAERLTKRPPAWSGYGSVQQSITAAHLEQVRQVRNG